MNTIRPSRRLQRGLARLILGEQAAVDLAQYEAGAQPEQLAAPAPGGLGDVARGGACVPPQRRVMLGLACETERAPERGKHGLMRRQ